jgi:GNAT superfamily N-acetyltransferase
MIRTAIAADIPALAALTVEAVAAGASIHFTAAVDQATAEAFWTKLLAQEAVTLVAVDDTGLAGTVTIGLDTPPNQRHRAEIRKLIVALRARRQGVAAALMDEIEALAPQHGRWLLTLDTVTGEAVERLYLRHGWTRDGIVEDFAYAPDGRLTGASLFSKRLQSSH